MDQGEFTSNERVHQPDLPDGQISKNLSSPARKNFPLFFRRKSSS